MKLLTGTATENSKHSPTFSSVNTKSDTQGLSFGSYYQYVKSAFDTKVTNCPERQEKRKIKATKNNHNKWKTDTYMVDITII